MLNLNVNKDNNSIKSTKTDYQETLKTNACGKAILVGEHAVVYGSRAIAFPLPSIRIKIKATFLDVQDSEVFNLDSDPVQKTIQKLFMQCCSILKKKTPRIQISSSCEIPVGAGLGASAALCVAIARMSLNYFDMTLDRHKVAQLANELEKNFHGNPSGLDTSVVSHESALLFRKNEQPQSCPMPYLESFVLVSSGLAASTSKMVTLAKPFFEGESGKELLQNFDKVTMDIYQQIQQKSPLADVAKTIKFADVLLKKIQVVPPKMADLIDFCDASGSIASKITGAGGGGFVLCLVPPKEQKSFTQKLRDHQIRYLRPFERAQHDS